ncbi:metalloprotease secretion chaperone CpaB [Acinetobacter sp. AS167]|uniref:metalloprotease secretion chaperone CpaB n=1 Tax=Acinetobacter sp. AS167 TaxID=3127884 RepID=UPI003018DBBC
MNKRMYLIIFVVLTVLVVSLLAWFISGQEDTAETMTSNKSDQIDQVNSPKLNANLSETQVLQRIKDSHARRKLVSLDKDKLRAGIFNQQMFYLSTVDTVSMYNPIPLTDAQKKDGRIFLRNDLYTLEAKNVGDQIVFNVPGYGLNRQAVIERIEVDPDEDIISWSGSLEGGDQNSEKFHITQTIKDNFTMGTITADDKTYAILMKNGYGWVNDVANESAALEAAEKEMDHVH